MTVSGFGVESLFQGTIVTPGNVAIWEASGILADGGVPPGGGGMAIGGTVTGGTAGSVLFIDGSGNLGQDNASFFWDDTNFAMKIGHTGTTTGAYFLNGVRGLYGVANVSGTNWFEANAGNTTTTGFLNFGTGDLALSSLTTGHENVALGAGALQTTQTDSLNVAVGSNSLHVLGLGGVGAGTNTGNIAIGGAALENMQTGQNNIGIGGDSLLNLDHGSSSNTAIGSNAGGSLGVGSGGAAINSNTMIGGNCGAQLQNNSNGNTWVGGYGGNPLTGVNSSIVIASGSSALNEMLDYGITIPSGGVWTFSRDQRGIPAGIHLYNVQGGTLGDPGINYERACLDFNITPNVFQISTQKGGTGVLRIITVDGFQKAGAPAAGDLPSGTFALINDTSGGNTWLVYNNAGTIRKVQLT